jgi:hypothetical protein
MTGDIHAKGAVVFGTGATLDGFIYSSTRIPNSKDTEVKADIKRAYGALLALTGGRDLAASSVDGELEPGLYVSLGAFAVPAGKVITLIGGPDDVWIFQINGACSIAGDIYMGGTAEPKNVQWVTRGAFAVAPLAVFYGTIITPAAISIGNGARTNGNLYAHAGAIRIGPGTTIKGPVREDAPDTPPPTIATTSPTVTTKVPTVTAAETKFPTADTKTPTVRTSVPTKTTKVPTVTTKVPTVMTSTPTKTPSIYNRCAHRFYKIVMSTGPTSKLETYVKEWSFLDANYKAIPISAHRAGNPDSSSTLAFDQNQATSYRSKVSTYPDYGTWRA